MTRATSRTSSLRRRGTLAVALLLTSACGVSACGGNDDDNGSKGQKAEAFDNPLTDPEDGPPAGHEGDCDVPADAAPEDVSSPDQVVGGGSPESCTADAFIEAVAAGGVITFDCGAEPLTITLDRPAKVFNDASDEIVIDGGGKITLSGGGATRILYMNTCDMAQNWTTDHCQDQDHPRLTVQNLTFIDANSKAEDEYDGGGAIWVRGGRFKVINSRFFNNVCADEGPDVGGAAIRVFSQYRGEPVYVVNSTFGGDEGLGNSCSMAGASAALAYLGRSSTACSVTTGLSATEVIPPKGTLPAAAVAAPSTTTATR